MDSDWILAEDAFSTSAAQAWEGLLTIGSDYMHTRASLEEHLSDAPQNISHLRMPVNVTAERFVTNGAKWGTYVPGIFGPHPTLNDEMVNLPWFLGLAPHVSGEKLDMKKSNVEGGERRLDLRSATLRRQLVWRSRAGPVIHVEYERFISGVHPSLSVQRMVLSSDEDVSVRVYAGVDADVRTSGFDHLDSVTVERGGDGGIVCYVETNGGDHCAMIVRMSGVDTDWRFESGRRRGDLVSDIALRAGVPVSVEKRTAVSASCDTEERSPGTVLDSVADATFEELQCEHAAYWEMRWQRSDVVIDGDPRSQLAVRASIYHLLRAHAGGNSGVAVDAKGYAGDAYFGRYFWDTEMYLLPFYVYTDPARAKTFVDFRVRSLDGARRNARRYGYPGARYAWESNKNGDECCPNWQYCDHEVHVTADVVHGFAHYSAAVDPEYVSGSAAESIVETARYWVSRVDWRVGDHHPSLLGVMGPDEYTPISSNNAYTNMLVARGLELASKVGERGGASPEEIEVFARVAAGLPVLRHSDNRHLVMQCEEFEGLAEPEFEKNWPDRSTCFAAAVSQERLYRTKCLKQADVIMLMTLFRDAFSDEECRAAWDYYVPYTTHDSSLSVGIHAIMALRLGLYEDAWRLFQAGLYKDMDVPHGGAAEGIHIAGCGCNWLVAVLGFAGMSTALERDVLSLQPRLPSEWSRLSFPVVWKTVPVHVDIQRASCAVSNNGGVPLDVVVGEQRRTVSPGATESFQV